MRRGENKLNKLLPDTQMVTYALRSFSELPVSISNISVE